MNENPFKRIGEEKICPYCKKKLSNIPSKKKKCEFCNNYIYVRTRPIDRKRVLVTEKQKEEIDEQWGIYSIAREDSLLPKDPEFVKKKKELKKAFGREPLTNDVKWGIYNDRLLEHVSTMQWGLYRCDKFDMANLLIKEGRLKQALGMLFEVCYLDLNGPENVPTFDGKLPSRERIKKWGIKEFELKMAFLAPGVIGIINDLLGTLNISKIKVKKLFTSINEETKPLKDMPLPAKKAWEILKKELRFLRK